MSIKNWRFPCYFPCSQGNAAGERFAPDCIHRHLLFCEQFTEIEAMGRAGASRAVCVPLPSQRIAVEWIGGAGTQSRMGRGCADSVGRGLLGSPARRGASVHGVCDGACGADLSHCLARDLGE